MPLGAGSAIERNQDGGDDPEHQSFLRAGFPAVRAGILSDVRGWWKGDVIPDDDFVSQDEARQVLGLRSPLAVGQLVARQILVPATRADGKSGVTRESVDAEMKWRRESNAWRRFRRGLGGIVHWLSF